MKRTIKFRGYNPNNKKWIYGYYLVNRGQHFIVEDGIAPPDATWEDYIVDEETIGQFTGLLDRNSVEVYEGDIIEFKNIQAVVVWAKHSAAFFTTKECGNSPLAMQMEYGYVVVGNIYDNS